MAGDSGGDTSSRASNETGASMAFSFTGNQVRLLGTVGPKGGLADVYLDGTKQLVGIDCWNPKRLKRHVLYYKNGLAPGEHELKIVVKGTGNARSAGSKVSIDVVQYSAATGSAGFGAAADPLIRNG